MLKHARNAFEYPASWNARINTVDILSKTFNQLEAVRISSSKFAQYILDSIVTEFNIEHTQSVGGSYVSGHLCKRLNMISEKAFAIKYAGFVYSVLQWSTFCLIFS